MGQVYQATDTKLNRQVALKILPEAFAGDPDRLAWFQREAQVLASLNHPGIAAIYGLEESDDTRALVLELVEGPTLADRIAQGPIPLDEALPIAKQIAEALAAAHEAGVMKVETDTEFVAGRSELLFEAPYYRDNFDNPSYDVSLDGEQFLMVQPAGLGDETAGFTIVLNWHQELLERVPVP